MYYKWKTQNIDTVLVLLFFFYLQIAEKTKDELDEIDAGFKKN